jgi:hypothetical protein
MSGYNIMVKLADKTTLSKLHNDHIREIISKESSLPKLKEELTTISQTDYQATLTFVQKKDNTIRIKELEEEIERIGKAKIDYLLSAGDIIHQYNEVSKSVYNPLRPNAETSDKKVTCYRSLRTKIDPDYVYHSEDLVNEENFCYDCNQFRVTVSEEALLACTKCGSQTTISIRSEKPSSNDPPVENKLYEYKRFTHFCDWLSNIQAKESPKPGIEEIVELVKKEVIRERMDTKLDRLTGDDIKRYLKKTKNNKWYDNIPQILYRITKIQPPQMSPDMEHNLKLMFMAIQEPYEMFKDNRHNFTSYSYIIYKFCELLGYTEFLSKLKLHKDEYKIYEHDQIWRKICQYMGGEESGWKFIKTHAQINKK